MKTALAVLGNISVASPCSASWEEMAGDDQVRFCGHCEKNVYNLSALTADEAVSLIREKEGDLCGRFFRRADGTVLTADCPVGVRLRVRRRNRRSLVAALAGVLALGSGCSSSDESAGTSTTAPRAEQQSGKGKEPAPEEKCLMGKIDVRD
jgi:hypothetical protein